MKKHLYEIKRLDIPSYLKWWFIQYKFGGTLSEVMENLTSPITLTDSLKRKFKIFEIGGNSVQDGVPTPESPIPIQNVTGTVNVKVENKNLYNLETLIKGYTINTTTGEIIVRDTKSITPLINVKENQEYIVWGYTLAMRVAFYDKDNNFISTQVKTSGASSGFTFVTPNGTKYLRLTGETSYFNDSVQLEEGSKTEFIAHEEQTVTFPTKEGQVLHLGDTLEDDGVHQRRFTKVFDGTENIQPYSDIENAFYITLSEMQANSQSLMSHYVRNDNSVSIMPLNTFKTTGGTGNVLFIKAEYETAAEVKAFFAEQYANGTPVTLESILAEPIIVPYTETQQEAYAKIKKLYSYEGTTYISSDNTPSLIFKIQYVKEE